MKLLLLLLFPAFVVAQTYDPSRMADWSRAGRSIPEFEAQTYLYIKHFGGIGDAKTPNDSAINRAFAALGGKPGIIYFPRGVYYFTSTITPPDSCIIRGDGARSTELRFDFGGKKQDAILIASGAQEVDTTNFTPHGELRKGAKHIFVNPGNIPEGTLYLRAYSSDSSLTSSDWAYGSVGQIVQVKADPRAIDVVNLSYPLRHDYDKLSVLKMRHAVGIECMRIYRMDSSGGKSSNIVFDHAVNSWVRGVESEAANYAHVSISYSSNIVVEGSYFAYSYAYTNGDCGNGLVLQLSSSDCLIQNNIFQSLRNSVLLQAGANGNVISYNYSIAPYWSGTAMPIDSAADLVLNGNYPFLNLFEGNICQNIFSVSSNGPFNTFFRNKADANGLVMLDPSDSQNFVGNNISKYSLLGNNHLEFCNISDGGVIPPGTRVIFDTSYYRSTKPYYFETLGYKVEEWPSIGFPIYDEENGAFKRFFSPTSSPTDCIYYQELPLSVPQLQITTNKLDIYPNPTAGKLLLPQGSYLVYDVLGNEVLSLSGDVDLSELSNGIYIIKNSETKRVGRVALVK